MTASLFSPLTLRGVTLRNRIGVAPMCQYSSIDGFASDWHLVHLGSRAVGGAALVFTEATAVEASGRISPQDLGIYLDDHCIMLSRITEFVRSAGAVAGIQLAHAGRKASTARPWSGSGAVTEEDGGWTNVSGPSPLPFNDRYPQPRELDAAGIERVVTAFADAAVRAVGCGFQVLEIHAAHGYLLHQFQSPLSNRRSDGYGGSFDNRIRLTLEVVRRIRSVIADDVPLVMRLSATDWTEGGWTPQETIELARRAAAEGVDMIDCSSGGNIDGAAAPIGPGYQTGFAADIRAQAGVATAAVGVITDPAQADTIIRTGQADMVLLARELLRDPYWPMRASRVLGAPQSRPDQYARAD